MKMTDLKEAMSITESFIKNNEGYHGYIVDSANTVEWETLCYVPFKELNPYPSNSLVGAYSGLIVDKNSKDYFQPGSALELEEWMYGFRIGLRGERYDLLIVKVYDQIKTIKILEKLELTYIKIEI
jgi:hypothetical protein